MKHIVIKGEPACLSQGFHLLKTGSVAKTVETIEGRTERKFQLIEVEQFDPISNEYKELGKHWADSITGSLYNPKTGECLTSTQIRMIV